MGIAITLKAYLNVCRISNLPSVWTNVLCAVVLATGGVSAGVYLVPALAMSCFYLAGMCLNDVCDAAYDATHRPTRPIPSGSVSSSGVLLLTVVLLVAGFVSLLTAATVHAVYAALLLVVAIVWYDLYHKQNPYSVLLMASCRFLIFIVTSLAVVGKVPATVLLAATVHFGYIVALSLVARYENGRAAPFGVPVIPLMLAGICVLDGILLAVLVSPVWLLAGVCGALLMQEGQKLVRGD